MATSSQTISNLLPQQIPDYVQEFYPLFVIFVTKYFEFLENSSSGVQYQLQNIQLNRDIDTTANDLAVQFLNTYVPNLPDTSAVDKTILVKYFRDFYRRKGSETSFYFFFKAFFNDDIEIIYPRDYMFNTSGGDWYAEKTLRVRSNTGNPLDLIHTYVTGTTSGARAIIDNVVQLNAAGGTDYYDLVLQPRSWVGSFVTSEAVVGIYYDHVNNVSSVISVTSVTDVLSAPGVYRNTRSQVSADQVLQDSLYYQQFSYVIRSRKDRETWANSILNHLNPSGLVLFNEFLDDVVTNNLSADTFSKTTLAETSVRIPTIKSYLVAPTITFDRIADQYTGTATTTIYLTNGTTTSVTYTSIGAITFDAAFDFNQENITFALQKDGDAATLGVPLTEIIRFDGASWDKFSKSVGVDEGYIAWARDINSSLVTTRYVAASSNLTAGTFLTSLSATIQTGVTSFPTATSVGSMLLVLTWMKNSRGNSTATGGESNNAVVVSISSNTTIVPRFNAEIQRNYRYVALGRSLEYNNLIYTHSSNSVTAFNVTSDLPLSSTVTNASLVFKPYNWERGLSYDRMIIELEVDQSLQLNTSLTETFNTANVTASGLIAAWSSTTTSVSVGYFGTNSSTARFAFANNVFVFNGPTGSSRFVQSRSFPATERLDLTVSYIVGDGYNGGDVPESGEDLAVQYSTNGGTSWLTAANLWTATDVWTFGYRPVSGLLHVTSTGTVVQGSDTLFLDEFDPGDVFTFTSSTGATSYTVVSITNNNLMTVSPAIVTASSGTILSGANLSSVLGTATISSNGDGTWNVAASSSTSNVIRVSGLSILSGSVISIQARVRLNSISNPGSPNFIVDYGDGPGRTLTLTQGEWVTTSFTLIGGPQGSLDFPGDNVAGFNYDVDFIRINGQSAFYRLPTAEQLRTTSITVYSGASVTAIVRIIQTGAGTIGLNQDLYAINDLKVDSFRLQATTGIVNIGVAVSSNSRLNISDTDFFNITTIGVN